MKTLRFISFFILLLFICIRVNGQITIDGTITDSEFQSISAALVEIIDQNDTSNYYSSVTNESGYFTISNITDIRSRKTNVPSEFIVLRNYPNPFNPTTIIYYELPKAENIEITIFDILGREVSTIYNNFHKAGTYTVDWDGRNNWNSKVAAGVYLCRLKTKDQFKVHKMILLDGGSTSSSATSSKVRKEKAQTATQSNSVFNFSLRITGNDILESNFQYLSCSSDTTINLKVPKILQTVVLGPEGGILDAEDFTLIVPQGAFSDVFSVNFSVDPNDSAFIQSSASPIFIIDGLPETIQRDLLVGIKPDESSFDTLFAAIGQYGDKWGTDGSDYYFSLEPTYDSLGYHFFKLDSNLNNFSSQAQILQKPNVGFTGSKNAKKIRLAFGYYYFDEGISFDYWFHRRIEDKVNSFQNFMTEIPKTFDQLGFYESNYENWSRANMPKMKVMITPFSTLLHDPFRYVSMVKPGFIKVKEFFVDEQDFEEIRREVAHYYYYLYFFNKKFDPNSSYKLGSKKWLAHDLHLKVLHHAIATWCEENFEPVDHINYVPRCFLGNETRIFDGLFLKINTDPFFGNEFNHGYGLSPLIKYLYDEYGAELLKKFYFGLEDKSGPESLLDAIRNTKSFDGNGPYNASVWLPSFYKKYISGKIYNVKSDTFLKKISKTIEFNDGDDYRFIDDEYTDLSAKLYKININSEEIKNKTLNFKIVPEGINIDYAKTLVFGLSNNTLTFLADGTDFNIAHFQSYDALLVCVVNSTNEAPYTGTSKIDLDIRVTDDLAFKYCDIRLAVIEMHDTLEGVWSPGWYTMGTFKDNVFDGKINTEKQGANTTGTIRVEVDDNRNILSLDVMAYHSDPTGFSSQWGFNARNIPPTENEPYLLVYSYLGNDVCNYVKGIYAKYTEVDGFEWEIKNHKCDQESNLHIKFHNWD
jgi:FlgD Ig-like domain